MAKEKNDSIPTINEGDLHSLLQEYRETAGYSLTQMAEALCLSKESLKSLENEEFQDLAEPPYVRGYLRNYAKLVEEDPSKVINIYESLRGANPADLDYHFKAKPKILTDSTRRMSPVMGQLLLLSLLLAFLVGISMIPAVNKWIVNTWNSFSAQTQAQSNPNIRFDNQDLMGGMPIPQPLPIEDQTASQEKAGDIAKANNSDSTANSAVVSTQALKNTTEEQTTQATDTTESPTATTANTDNNSSSDRVKAQMLTPEELSKQTTATDETIDIKLIFNSEVWMRIKDKNNKTVFEGLHTTGGSKTLILSKPLHFRVGNAHGLSLFVDDQPMDISGHIRGSVAKFSLE